MATNKNPEEPKKTDVLMRLSPEETPSEQEVIRVRSAQPINDIARASRKREGVPNVDMTRTLYAQGKQLQRVLKAGQTQLIFDDPELKLPRMMSRTHRLLMALISTLPESIHYKPDTIVRANTTKKDLMELFGLSSDSEARKTIKEDLEALVGMHLRINDKSDPAGIAGGGIPLAGDLYAFDKRGNITFPFSPTFIQLIASGDSFFFLLIDPRAFKVNFKTNPYSWQLYWRILNHNSVNLGKPNETILNVPELLDSASELPRYEEISDRLYTRRIIKPFERDMNALVSLGVLEYWDYCHEKGAPLTDEEQRSRLDDEGNEKELPYEIAVNCYVTWKLANQYRREERLEHKQAHRKKLAAIKEANKEAARKSEDRIQRRKERKIAEAEAEEELKERRKGRKKPSA